MDLGFQEKIDLMARRQEEFTSPINAEFIREILSTSEAEKRFKQGHPGNNFEGAAKDQLEFFKKHL